MRLTRHAFGVLSAFLLGLSALLQASTTEAGVNCYVEAQRTRCDWRSDWGDNQAVRVTIGKDTAGNTRWVASPIDPPSWELTRLRTGTMRSARWTFFGTQGNDVMVEVPRSSDGTRFVHGSYSLGAPSPMSGGIHFIASGGANIIVGGNYTRKISVYDSGADLSPVLNNIFVLFPNQSSETVDPNRDLSGGAGQDYFIVAPAIVSGTTSNKIRMEGSLGSDLYCNLSPSPAGGIWGVAEDIGRFGSFNSVSPSTLPTNNDIGNLCVVLYLSAMDLVLRPVQ